VLFLITASSFSSKTWRAIPRAYVGQEPATAVRTAYLL
jgi:hypothetical protein